jgi:hypothetical protein
MMNPAQATHCLWRGLRALHPEYTAAPTPDKTGYSCSGLQQASRSPHTVFEQAIVKARSMSVNHRPVLERALLCMPYAQWDATRSPGPSQMSAAYQTEICHTAGCAQGRQAPEHLSGWQRSSSTPYPHLCLDVFPGLAPGTDERCHSLASCELQDEGLCHAARIPGALYGKTTSREQRESVVQTARAPPCMASFFRQFPKIILFSLRKDRLYDDIFLT